MKRMLLTGLLLPLVRLNLGGQQGPYEPYRQPRRAMDMRPFQAVIVSLPGEPNKLEPIDKAQELLRQ